MSKAHDAVTAIMDETKRKMQAIAVESAAESRPEDVLQGEFNSLQTEAVWSAILELAKRIDAAPGEAARELHRQMLS